MRVKFVVSFACIVVLSGCVTLVTKESFNDLVTVVDVQASSDKIFDRTLHWIATSYVSPKQVIQFSDKETGLITFNGSMYENIDPWSDRIINYKMIVEIKNNKFRLQMVVLSWENVKGRRTDMGELFSKRMERSVRMEYGRIKKDLYDHIAPSLGGTW